ncbi:MAG: ATP-binding protein, partial [Muribaculaceae bacterium]|nr:ATP-binding protein [Muribaculaceae bacterium]
MATRMKYPIGQQDFKTLRMRDCVYVDKTRFIDKIVHEGSQYYFFARPRRFGKSLFLSTLQYFFEGERELFKGLYIDKTDWKWEKYPVLRLDLNTTRYETAEMLKAALDRNFRSWEEQYDIEVKDNDYSQRFATIIKAAHEKTGLQVVILVDEYDKPLVGNLNNNDNLDHYRVELSSLYSNFKSSAEHIRLVFLTGVSRFSKLSVFSDLNNLNDITFDEGFSDICGITEKEMFDYFTESIEELAYKSDMSFEDTCEELKRNYDGYRFTKSGSYIYNPWSVLNCLDKKEIANYWNETGMPTLLAESLKRVNADLEKTFNIYCTEDELKGLDLLNPNPLALLFQTGYLTIKCYNSKIRRIRLGLPNNEVKKGFLNVLLPYYVSCKHPTSNQVVDEIVINFILGNPDNAMKAMQTYFAGIDFKLKIENENNFHNAFYLLMDLIGLDTKAEAHTSDGSIDIVIKTEDYIYIIELKYDHSAEEALRQIKEKRYARPYQTDNRRIIEIGVSFSSTTRCIE